jgi:homoserine O-succinyltransferase
VFVKPVTQNGANAGNGSRPDIVVGLVNIMPPAAMRTIELLFRRLLDGFGSPANIYLRVFTLQSSPGEAPNVPPDYEGLDALWDSPDSALPLDALIVTGTEARARLMTDEPCWPDLQKICDWAGQNTISTIWSCFSAHAAVLHMDNIHREPLAEKLTGVFECEKASVHPILKNMPDRWAVPHSRYNNLNEAELAASGYEILSRSGSVGADSFIKQHKNSQFLFLQGHLEYGPERLFSEYCRDLKRFSQGQRTVPPKLPENYLDQTAMTAFAALQGSMQSMPDALSAADFVNAMAACLSIDWQAPAQQLFASWLSYVSDQKSALLNAQLGSQFAPGAFRDLPPSQTAEYVARP